MNLLNARHIIALTLYGECRGEPLEGQLAVAAVLRNRLTSGRWGHTYQTVCLAPHQFSCWSPGDPNLPTLQRLAEQLGDWADAEDIQKNRALQTCLWVADGLLGEHFTSPVGASTHYFASSLKDAPAWARTGQFVVAIGRHLFFAGVP